MPFYYSCCVIIWPVLVGPLLGMLYAFLLLYSSGPILSLGKYSCCFRFPWPIPLLSGFLGPFHPFRHHRPILILYSHEPLLSLLGFPGPNYHIFYSWDLWAFPPTRTHLIHYLGPLWPILACFLFLIMPMGLLLLSLGSFRSACFFWGLFTIF